MLQISGDAVIDGTIEIILGFAPAIGDQFQVINSATAITSCTLPASISTYYNNHLYTFDVICNADNVTLERSCILPVGCTNSYACNFDPSAMCEDDSCTFLQGDANHDGAVNVLDLISVSSNFGCTGNCPVGDANFDNSVNVLDLIAVSSNFGNTCP